MSFPISRNCRRTVRRPTPHGQGGGRASVTIPFDAPSQLHRLADAEIGDTLLVVTALVAMALGFILPRSWVIAFLAAVALIALGTVALQALRTANANPVDALRYE